MSFGYLRLFTSGKFYGVKPGARATETSFPQPEDTKSVGGITYWRYGPIQVVFITPKQTGVCHFWFFEHRFQEPNGFEPSIVSDYWVLNREVTPSQFEVACSREGITILNKHVHTGAGLFDFEVQSGLFVCFNSRDNCRGKQGLFSASYVWKM